MRPVKTFLVVGFLHCLVVGSESEDGLLRRVFSGALSRKILERSARDIEDRSDIGQPSVQLDRCHPNFCHQYSPEIPRGGDIRISRRDQCLAHQGKECLSTVTSSPPLKITTAQTTPVPPKVAPTVATVVSKDDAKHSVRIVMRSGSKSHSQDYVVTIINHLQLILNWLYSQFRKEVRFQRATDISDDIEILMLPSSPKELPDGSLEIDFVAKNKTTNEIIPEEKLMKILKDPEFKKAFEKEGYELVSYGPDPGLGKPTPDATTGDDDETVFEAHMGLWIAMMVIAAICVIIIIIGIIYMCCRQQRHGFLTPRTGKGLVNDPERGENGQGNPIPDDEIVKDEQPMLEKEVPNGNGVPITKLDEENCRRDLLSIMQN